jgi:drug/metabolite transporter, DME family
LISQDNFRRDFSLIVFASVSWGTVGIANRFLFASSATNALSLSFLRLAIAAPLFFLAGWTSLKSRLFDIQRRDLRTMMVMGCLIALSQAFYIAAISYAGVSVSTLIAICAAPVIVVLLSAILAHERVTLMTLIALAAAVGGTVLLIVTPSRSSLSGNVSSLGALLAFLSACSYAGFIFCGRLLTNRYHPLQISTVSFGTGALLLLVCASSTRLALDYQPAGWLILLYLGSIPTALGYGLFQVGIRSLSATLASIVTMFEPLTAAVLAWLLFHEVLGPAGLLGAGLLLGAMAIILLVPKKYFE